jgi:hypothetical protein
MPTDHDIDAAEIPSTQALIRSTVIAAVVATLLLITVVMPAEYGIDPTGIGSITGLQRMGEIKRQLSEEASRQQQALETVSGESQAYSPAASTQAAGQLEHEMQVTLAPNASTEIKVTLAKGKAVQYTWQSDGGPASFDVHGDSKALDINYHSYGKGAERKSEGEIVAKFDGQHGWYWRNRTRETFTITLQTKGEYTDIKHLK